MPLITSVSDEIIALELGAVVTRGAPDEVLSDPRVISAYLGGDVDVINRSGASRVAEKRKASPRKRPLRATRAAEAADE